MAIEISCTRAEADHDQIVRCRETLGVYSDEISEISKVLVLAGNETRLKILFLLNKEGELCPCDLGDILKMSVPGISQHLRKMKDIGMVIIRRDKQTLYYSIAPQSSTILENIFNNIQPGKLAV